jgi:CHAT domain-containing protein
MKMASEDDVILARLESFGKDLELIRNSIKPSESTANRTEDKTPWYMKAIQILGVPAALLAIFVQWGQFNLNSGSTEKSRAEAAKINVETEELKIELQKKTEALKTSSVATTDLSSVNNAIATINETLSRAEKLNNEETKSLFVDIIMNLEEGVRIIARDGASQQYCRQNI